MFWYSFELGLAPIVIGIFMLGGIQLLVLGILGEYIGEILTRVTRRPMVVERERINFDSGESIIEIDSAITAKKENLNV